MINSYFFIFISFVVSLSLALLIFAFSYYGVVKEASFEKLVPYECGFDPFENSRNPLDVRFYLVGILFIVFDIEINFLYPWAIAIAHINFMGIISMFIFFIILLVGFFYEWRKGALDWELVNFKC